MRLRRQRPATSQLLLLPVLASCLSTASAFITLSQFQQIDGFSVTCTSAYNSPIPGCTTSDFNPQDAPCSQSCATGLGIITTTLNTACKGVLADPTTLIGLFFEGKGVHALCPQIESSLDGEDTDTTTSTTSTTSSTSTSSTSTSTKRTSTTSTTSATELDTTLSTITTSSQSAAQTSFELDSTSEARITTETTVATPEAATAAGSSSSAPPSATTTGPAVFGGGAIPFTVNNKAGQKSDASRLLDRVGATSLLAACLWAVVAVL